MKIIVIGDIVGEKAVEKLEKELKQFSPVDCAWKSTVIIFISSLTSSKISWTVVNGLLE